MLVPTAQAWFAPSAATWKRVAGRVPGVGHPILVVDRPAVSLPDSIRVPQPVGSDCPGVVDGRRFALSWEPCCLTTGLGAGTRFTGVVAADAEAACRLGDESINAETTTVRRRLRVDALLPSVAVRDSQRESGREDRR